MNDILTEYCLDKLNELSEQLKECEQIDNQISVARELIKYINDDSINYEEINNLINNINIKELNELNKKFNLLFKFKESVEKIEYDLENYDINELKQILVGLSIENNCLSLLENLATIKKIFIDINKPNFIDLQIKQDFLEMKKLMYSDFMKIVGNVFLTYRKQINIVLNNFIIKNFSHIKFQKKELIKRVTLYKNIVDGTKFSSLDDIDIFYEDIKNSYLSSEEKNDIIIEFSKYVITKQEKQLSENNSSIIDTETNSKEVILSIELSDEEKNIISRLDNLLLQNFPGDDFDEDLIELLESDIFVSRDGVYQNGTNLDWRAIATDIKCVLYPNLNNNNKEQIMEMLKMILTVIDNYNAYIDKKTKFINKWTEVQKQFKSKLKILEEFTKRKNNKSYYDNICIWLTQNDTDCINQMITYITEPLVYFEYINILQSLANIDKIINEDIDFFLSDDESYIVILNEIDELVELMEEKEKSSELKQYLNSIHSSEEQEEEKGQIDFSGTQNLVYCMFDDFKDLDDSQKEELKETTKRLLETKWYNLTDKKHFKEKLFYVNNSGKRVYYEKEGIDAWRIWAKPGTRTGIVKLNICEENQIKIKKRYGLDNINTIILITGVIHSVGASHIEYQDLIYIMEKNKNRINSIRKIFENPNCNDDEFFDIVDTALNLSKRISNGNFSELKNSQ